MKLLLLPALLLAGCTQNVATNPPAPPTPPQVTVSQSVLALAHAVGGATDALIACRTQQKCDAADVSNAENVVTAIATTGKAVDAELQSADPWSAQKTKILGLVTAAGVAQLKAKVSPSTQLLIASIVTLYSNISLAVGGPVL